MSEKPTSQPQWVKLHLVPQTEGRNTMPPYVVGLLIAETQSSYILNPILETEDQDYAYSGESQPAGMSFINRTYVWRCQILESKPNPASSEPFDDVGGMG